MADDHAPPIPTTIEAVLPRLGELEIVLGPGVRPAVDAARRALREASAARDRGDAPAVVAKIGEAMDRLSALADDLDPAEATLMRALTQTFRQALLHGDAADARRAAAVMFERSGAREVKKKD